MESNYETMDISQASQFLNMSVSALRAKVKQGEKACKTVGTYRGKPVKQLSIKAWYKALKKAEIKEFRWHDLRHTWASWHVQNGTPLNVLQELGGWESVEKVCSSWQYSFSKFCR